MAFYTDVIKVFDENLKTLQEDLVSYETDLASLYEPFSHLMVAYQNQNDIIRQSQISVGAPPVQPVFAPRSRRLFFNRLKFGKVGDIDRITLILFVFYLLLTMMNLWSRACFIDVKSFFL